jgi:hypothetical protein
MACFHFRVSEDIKVAKNPRFVVEIEWIQRLPWGKYQFIFE